MPLSARHLGVMLAGVRLPCHGSLRPGLQLSSMRCHGGFVHPCGTREGVPNTHALRLPPPALRRPGQPALPAFLQPPIPRFPVILALALHHRLPAPHSAPGPPLGCPGPNERPDLGISLRAANYAARDWRARPPPRRPSLAPTPPPAAHAGNRRRIQNLTPRKTPSNPTFIPPQGPAPCGIYAMTWGF